MKYYIIQAKSPKTGEWETFGKGAPLSWVKPVLDWCIHEPKVSEYFLGFRIKKVWPR
jgi:hypothetical protein